MSEWPDYTAVQAERGSLSGNELTRNSSGNTRLQSSQLAEPLWTDRGLKSGLSVRELNFTFKKKKKKAKAGNELSNILPKSSYARKKPPLLWKEGAGGGGLQYVFLSPFTDSGLVSTHTQYLL